MNTMSDDSTHNYKNIIFIASFVFLLNCLVLSFDLNIVQIAVRPANV